MGHRGVLSERTGGYGVAAPQDLGENPLLRRIGGIGDEEPPRGFSMADTMVPPLPGPHLKPGVLAEPVRLNVLQLKNEIAELEGDWRSLPSEERIRRREELGNKISAFRNGLTQEERKILQGGFFSPATAKFSKQFATDPAKIFLNKLGELFWARDDMNKAEEQTALAEAVKRYKNLVAESDGSPQMVSTLEEAKKLIESMGANVEEAPPLSPAEIQAAILKTVTRSSIEAPERKPPAKRVRPEGVPVKGRQRANIAEPDADQIVRPRTNFSPVKYKHKEIGSNKFGGELPQAADRLLEYSENILEYDQVEVARHALKQLKKKYANIGNRDTEEIRELGKKIDAIANNIKTSADLIIKHADDDT